MHFVLTTILMLIIVERGTFLETFGKREWAWAPKAPPPHMPDNIKYGKDVKKINILL